MATSRELETTLAGLLSAQISEVPIVLGENRDELPKGHIMSVYMEDATLFNPSITNIFEAKLAINYMVHQADHQPSVMEAVAKKVYEVITSPTLVDEFGAMFANVDTVSKEIDDPHWVNTWVLRLITQIDETEAS